MKYPKSQKFELMLCDGDRDVEVEVSYNPGYAPAPCHNHDDPAYSDPGSGPELDIIDAKYTDNGEDAMDFALRNEDELLEKAGEKYTDYGDHYDGRYED